MADLLKSRWLRESTLPLLAEGVEQTGTVLAFGTSIAARAYLHQNARHQLCHSTAACGASLGTIVPTTFTCNRPLRGILMARLGKRIALILGSIALILAALFGAFLIFLRSSFYPSKRVRASALTLIGVPSCGL